MTDTVTIEAASQQAALEQAMSMLGVGTLDEIAWTYDRDHFRTGARTVKIQARKKEEVASNAPPELKAAAPRAKAWVEDLLREFGCMDAQVSVRLREESVIVLVRSQEDGALLIGKEGRNIEGFQILFDRAAERLGLGVRVMLDIGDYRARRDDQLCAEAQHLAERVKDSGVPERMRPLNSYERHLVHSAVKEVDGVGSRSIWDGNLKQVEIHPLS